MKYRNVFYLLNIIVIVTVLTLTIIPPGMTSAQETTIVTVSAPSEVNTGDQFIVSISVEPGTTIAGVQLSLSFDQSLVTANSINEGNLLSQGGATTYFNPGVIYNATGTVSGVVGAITTPDQTISTAGTFATITLTAGAVGGTCPLTLSGVVVGDENGQSVSVSTVNTQVTIDSQVTTNNSPVLNLIGNKSVYEDNLLQFTVSASDVDGDTLTFFASNIPLGASFNPETMTFSWIPTSDQASEYAAVHFEVSDGELTDSEDITITVLSTEENEQDIASPVIHEVMTSYVSTDSAVIRWTTTEPSTSQVEYWASPSQFSPLDETLVTEHEVRLTGLRPSTEYQYRTISQNEAGSQYISPVFEFTTPIKPATFTMNWMTITPAEAVIGQEVTIHTLITNTGDVIGSYDVTLSVDGTIEATKSIIDLAGGANEEVTFVIIKETTGIYNLNVNGTTYTLVVNDAEEPEEIIELFSIIPNYEGDTGVIISARVEYGIYEAYYSTPFSQPNTEFILKVNLDNNLLEEVTLIASDQLEQDRNTGSINYIPDEGWTSGTYTFQAELSTSEATIETSPLVRLVITPAAVARVVNWAILGEIIVGMLIVTLLVVLLILHHTRDMLRDQYTE